MDDELKPLTPDLKALLDTERAAPNPPAPRRERVRARVWASLGLVGLGVGTASAAGTSTPALGTAASTAALKAAPKLLTKALLGKVVLGLAAAAGLGLGVQLALRAPAPSAPPKIASAPSLGQRPPAVTPPPAVVPPPSAPAPAPSAPVIETRAPRPAHRAVDAADEDSDELAAERALLEQGRFALAHGDSGKALRALERYGQRFPHGQLVEERESLLIRALAASGDDATARARGAAFARRFPKSIFLPAVDATLKSLP